MAEEQGSQQWELFSFQLHYIYGSEIMEYFVGWEYNSLIINELLRMREVM